MVCLADVSDSELLQELSKRSGVPAASGEGLASWAARFTEASAGPKNIAISSLYDSGEASPRLFRACRKLRTLGDAADCTEETLGALYDMSPQAIYQLTELLSSYGLSLRPVPPDPDCIDNPAGIRIDDLAVDGIVSPRTWESLKAAGVKTLGDLVHLTYSDVISIHGIGPVAEAEISEMLARYGLHYKRMSMLPEVIDPADPHRRLSNVLEELKSATGSPKGALTGNWYTVFPGGEVEGPYRSVQAVVADVEDRYDTAYTHHSRKLKEGVVVTLSPIWGDAPTVFAGRPRALLGSGLLEPEKA